MKKTIGRVLITVLIPIGTSIGLHFIGKAVLSLGIFTEMPPVATATFIDTTMMGVFAILMLLVLLLILILIISPFMWIYEETKKMIP